MSLSSRRSRPHGAAPACRAVLVALAALAIMACSSSGPGSNTADDEGKPPPQDEGPRRVPLSTKLLDDNRLTVEDVAELQLFVNGRILLRREASSEKREITKQHTLRIVDGKYYDEVLLEDGTPGISLDDEDGLFVNFDPEAKEAGLTFELTEFDRYKLRTETDEEGKGAYVTYDGDSYKVMMGGGAFLEIDREELLQHTKNVKTLPGNVLPEAEEDKGIPGGPEGETPPAQTPEAPPPS